MLTTHPGLAGQAQPRSSHWNLQLMKGREAGSTLSCTSHPASLQPQRSYQALNSRRRCLKSNFSIQGAVDGAEHIGGAEFPDASQHPPQKRGAQPSPPPCLPAPSEAFCSALSISSSAPPATGSLPATLSPHRIAFPTWQKKTRSQRPAGAVNLPVMFSDSIKTFCCLCFSQTVTARHTPCLNL